MPGILIFSLVLYINKVACKHHLFYYVHHTPGTGACSLSNRQAVIRQPSWRHWYWTRFSFECLDKLCHAGSCGQGSSLGCVASDRWFWWTRIIALTRRGHPIADGLKLQLRRAPWGRMRFQPIRTVDSQFAAFDQPKCTRSVVWTDLETFTCRTILTD